MNAPARVVIATRKSPLALWQAEHVRALLSNAAFRLADRAARYDHAGRPYS